MSSTGGGGIHTQSKKTQGQLFEDYAQIKLWCFKFKHLRILGLCSCSYSLNKILDSIGGLVHLRFLDLCGCKQLRKLPKSIAKLHQLQSLCLVGCDCLEELPSNIRYMINLRHFSLTTRQTRLEGIEYLTSLRTLILTGCSNLVALLDGMQTFTHLRILFVSNCGRLASLPSSMKHLTRLEILRFYSAKKLNLEEFDGFENLKTLSSCKLP